MSREVWYLDEAGYEPDWFDPDERFAEHLRSYRARRGLDEPDERERPDHRGRYYHYAPGYEPRD